MVMFRDGYPSKKEYRRFKIQSVDKPDDFESMREVVQRRYSRLIKEKKDLEKIQKKFVFLLVTLEISKE